MSYCLCLLIYITGVEFNNDSHTVALWHFNEGEGDTLYDSSGNGHNGEIFGAAWSENGMFGSCLSFDGRDDFIEVPNAEDLIPSEELTLELWVKIPVYPSVHFALMSKSDNYHSGSGYLWGIENTGKPKSYFNTTDWKFSSAIIVLNNWSYLVITINHEKLRYYLNGRETDHFKVDPGDIINNRFNLIIGRTENTNTYFLNGFLDEVRISNKARSAEEIKQSWLTFQHDNKSVFLFQLKNGDKISGDIIQPLKVDVETDYGRLMIPLTDVVMIDFGGKRDSDIIMTPYSKINGKIAVDTFILRTSLGDINVPKKQINKIEH